MRRSQLSVVFAGLIVVLAASTAAVSAVSSAQAVVPINVRITCDGDNVGEFSISAQSARLSKSAGDTARFALLGGSDVSEVQVRPKTDVAWPFVGEAPTFGVGRDAATGAIDPDISPGVYGYDLIVTCGGTVDTIDPNMDIRP